MLPRRFHVVAIDPSLTRVLAETTATHWTLPSFDDDSHRALPEQVAELLSHLNGASWLVHEAPLATDAARYEGYCVAMFNGHVGASCMPDTPEVRWVSVAELLSGHARSMTQRDALVTSMARLRRPVAPFDSAARVAAALAWAACEIERYIGSRPAAISRHRCSRYDYVVRFTTPMGGVCFKGGPDRIADEAVLTMRLHELCPTLVPETIAIDRANEWWLYRELRGDQLMGNRLTMPAALAAVRALARLQQRALDAPRVRAHLSSRSLTATELVDRADRIVLDATARSESPCGVATRERWRVAKERLLHEAEAQDRGRIPSTLVLSDFCGRNVLATDEGIGLIDVERSYWGHPVLSLYRLLREIDQSTGGDAGTRAIIELTYASEWRQTVEIDVMMCALASLSKLGPLFSIVLMSMELDLEAREFGMPLPPSYRADRLGPRLLRLLDALAL